MEALDRGLLAAVRAEWVDLNHQLFGDSLKVPVFTVVEGGQRLGSWTRGVRELALSRRLMVDHGWDRVIEVLKHEMAHQFVDEVLGVDETDHGPAFRRLCSIRGIDARATEPHQEPKNDSDQRLLRRVEKLLRLADSAEQHEAEAAMARAQAILRTHNLEAPLATTSYGYRWVGVPKGRVYEPARRLAGLLAEHFFVDAIWVRAFDVKRGVRGSVLELCGRPENLEIAVYVHDYLQRTAERLWKLHCKSRGIRGNKERRAFTVGVYRGFAEKLRKSRVTAEEKGLIWVGDPHLQAFMKTRHPKVVTVRRDSARSSDALEAGRAAGKRIVLSKGVGSEGRNRGRLLGSGS